MPLNHSYRLAQRPQGLPTRESWDWVEEEVGSPAEGEVLVAVRMISLDPAMRGWMNDTRSYVPPVGIGEVMRAGAVGEVIESAHEDFAPGDHVTGLLGVQEHALVAGAALTKIDPEQAPLEKWLGVLGMPGMTAYFGLLDVGRLQEGDTLLVSAAAGAVGQLVGQIGKLKGCRVVGIAGGPEKCAWIVDELGFDGAIDYKGEAVARAIHRECPDGVDVYFDNVGGEILDAALGALRRGARVVICGAISQYNATDAVRGPANYLSLLVNRASMTGFVVFDFYKRYGEGMRDMGQWLSEGRIQSREDLVQGLEHFPEALLKLFSGENSGKLILRV